MKKENTKQRCGWVGTDPIYVKYHDEEWGVPVYDDKKQFEFLTLESAQAGLSWITILKRRDGYRRAFANFDVEKVSKFTEKDFDRLVKDVGIIRNKLKIRAAINNSRVFLSIQKEFGSFTSYMWGFVGNKQVVNLDKSAKEIPATTHLSDSISSDLKKRGMSFVGSTIIYAHLQATGIVNDHATDCFKHKEVQKISEIVQ